MNTLELQSIVFILTTWLTMLITNEQHELTDHLYLVNLGERIWRLVNLDLQAPHFLVTYEIREGEYSIRQTGLLWRLIDLLGLCEQIRVEIGKTLIQVTLLSPSQMNGQDGWQTNSVKEIWAEQDATGARLGVSYVTQNGQRYFDPPTLSGEEGLEQREMLLSL